MLSSNMIGSIFNIIKVNYTLITHQQRIFLQKILILFLNIFKGDKYIHNAYMIYFEGGDTMFPQEI